MGNESIDLNKGADYVSYVSRTLTDQLVEFLNNQGISVSARWVGLMVLFLSCLIFFLAMKISKPIVKYILIGSSIVLIGGLLIPW